MTQAADCDAFAAVYDRNWGPISGRLLSVLDRLLPDELVPGKRVLDLCCGTGQLVVALTRRGYEVTGIAVSAAMIERARRNAPGATFQIADARTFNVAEPVEVALSSFDSLNHLMSLSDLTDVFRCVRAALAEGGTFAFDLNMEEGYLSRWQGSFGIPAKRT